MSGARRKRRLLAWEWYIQRWPEFYAHSHLEPVGLVKARYAARGWSQPAEFSFYRSRRRWIWRHNRPPIPAKEWLRRRART